MNCWMMKFKYAGFPLLEFWGEEHIWKGIGEGSFKYCKIAIIISSFTLYYVYLDF